MCMTIPSRVLHLDGAMATVDSLGTTRATSLVMLDEPVAVGDYLLLGVGGAFAMEKIPPQQAEASLALLRQAMDQGFA